jgi:hypothetical protein
MSGNTKNFEYSLGEILRCPGLVLQDDEAVVTDGYTFNRAQSGQCPNHGEKHPVFSLLFSAHYPSVIIVVILKKVALTAICSPTSTSSSLIPLKLGV